MKIYALLLLVVIALFIGNAAAMLEPEINFTGSADNYTMKFAHVVFADDSQPAAIGGRVVFRTNDANATTENIRGDAAWMNAAVGLAIEIEAKKLSPQGIMDNASNLSEEIKKTVLGMETANDRKIEILEVHIDDINAYENVYCASENNRPTGISNPLINEGNRDPQSMHKEASQFAANIFFLFVGIMIGIVSINYLEKKK